jgi:hypothetical protein
MLKQTALSNLMGSGAEASLSLQTNLQDNPIEISLKRIRMRYFRTSARFSRILNYLVFFCGKRIPQDKWLIFLKFFD